MIAGLVFTFRDVTEQRRVVGELTDEVNRYRFLAENASEVLIMASATREISYASATSARVLGTDADDLIGVDVCDLLHPDDRAFVESALTHAGGPATWRRSTHEHCGPSPTSTDGSTWWPDAWLGTRATLQYHVSINDISARRDAERAMAASEQRFRSLASQTRELVTMVDPRGVITYVSPSVVDVLGHDHGALIGQSVANYVHRDEFDELAHRVFDQSTAEALRHRARSTPTARTDGSRRSPRC